MDQSSLYVYAFLFTLGYLTILAAVLVFLKYRQRVRSKLGLLGLELNTVCMPILAILTGSATGLVILLVSGALIQLALCYVTLHDPFDDLKLNDR